MEGSESVVFQIDWAQIITLVGGIVSLIGSMLYIVYKKLLRRMVFIEAWQCGFEYVYSKKTSKDGNGQVAAEIREERNKKLQEWKFKHLVKE